MELSDVMKSMRKKSIVRITPTLGMVSHWWCQAVERIFTPMNTVKGALFIVDKVGGKIAETRNFAVAKALTHDTPEVEVDSIFWLDDDVICHPAVIRQLYWHEKPIVSGVYFIKEHGHFAEPIIFTGRGSGTAKYVPAADGETKSADAWMGSMGLSLVKMEVYRRIRDELDIGVDENGNHQWYKTTAGDPQVEGDCLDLGGTEDSYFMGMVHKLGYACHVDYTKYAFGFHYCSREKRGYPEKQWDQYEAALGGSGKPIEWPQPDGSVITWK